MRSVYRSHHSKRAATIRPADDAWDRRPHRFPPRTVVYNSRRNWRRHSDRHRDWHRRCIGGRPTPRVGRQQGLHVDRGADAIGRAGRLDLVGHEVEVRVHRRRRSGPGSPLSARNTSHERRRRRLDRPVPGRELPRSRRPRLEQAEESAGAGPAAGRSASTPATTCGDRIGSTALAFRGYDVTNLGRSRRAARPPGLRADRPRGARRGLGDRAPRRSARPVDLAAHIRAGAATTLDDFPQDVATIVAMELAQLAHPGGVLRGPGPRRRG